MENEKDDLESWLLSQLLADKHGIDTAKKTEH
jgi:hypothetical protein